MMMSRLLTHLDAAIERADSPLHAACLRAERAAHWSRQGNGLRAREEIDTLRHDMAWRPSELLNARILVAEGVLFHCESLACDAAGEAFDAAYAVTARPAAQSLRPLAASWCASMAYNQSRHEATARLLREAFVGAPLTDHATRMRASLVAADTFNWAGRAVMAARWYEVSRRHAVAYGDETHISGMLFNQSNWQEIWLRMRSIFGDAMPQEATAQAVTAVDSTEHFDSGLGLSSLPSLVPTMRAQVLTSLGGHAKALALFDQHLDGALLQGMARSDGCLYADRAWCELQLGLTERARASVALSAAALQRNDADAEEMAMAHERLRHAQAHFGDAVASQHHGAQAQVHLQRFRAKQADTAHWLDSSLSDIAPSVSAGLGVHLTVPAQA